MNGSGSGSSGLLKMFDRGMLFSLVTVPRFIIGSMILIGIVVNFGNVIGRYLFLSPIIWAEEAMIYIMVWTVFIGAGLVSWEGRHLRMDFFTIMLPSPWKEVLNLAGVLASIAVCIFVLPQAYTVVAMVASFDQRSVVAEVPMVIPHFAILLGFSIMLLGMLYRFRRHVIGDLETEVDDLVAEFGQDSDDNSGDDGERAS